ncbi:hypothetical protein CLOM_g9685 [Closterium sp. NIES-68]|nr:hypothetical protein CLOM_g5602 [Closterium sp. NIES-68]GJP50526.1 hypothetical protein CLOM_g9685 [Closterium sp. NIES-68]GJP58533.1 hypothetical protein CLOP_g388 [Closterium sp. NIES-67]
MTTTISSASLHQRNVARSSSAVEPRFHREVVQSDAVRNELVRAFRLIDTNGDGRISYEELSVLLNRLGIDDGLAVVQDIIGHADRDGDGQIDVEEFLLAAHKAPCNCHSIGAPCWHENEDLQKAFTLFDCDNSGDITAEELQQAIWKLSGDSVSLSDCQRMIARVDSNGDGMVDFNEFQRMMEGVFG